MRTPPDPAHVDAVVSRILARVRAGTHEPNPTRTLAQLYGEIPLNPNGDDDEVIPPRIELPVRTITEPPFELPTYEPEVPTPQQRWAALKTRLIEQWRVKPRKRPTKFRRRAGKRKRVA